MSPSEFSCVFFEGWKSGRVRRLMRSKRAWRCIKRSFVDCEWRWLWRVWGAVAWHDECSLFLVFQRHVTRPLLMHLHISTHESSLDLASSK
jgi:hypothetical protein